VKSVSQLTVQFTEIGAAGPKRCAGISELEMLMYSLYGVTLH